MAGSGTGGWQWQGSSPTEQAGAFSMGFGGIVSPLLSAWSAGKSYKAQAASLMRDSALYARQGAMLMGSAAAYASGGRAAISVGKANARNERLRAAQVDPVRDRQLEGAILERRAKVGQGLAEAAANGILLEGRTGAAIAMWEQDEAADLAYEQAIIMQDAEDTIWNLRMSANAKEAEGYGQAAQMYGQAASAAASAWQAHMQGAWAVQDAMAAQKAAKKAKRGGIGSAILSGIGMGVGAYFGGPAGMMIGSSLGSATGSVYQAR